MTSLLSEVTTVRQIPGERRRRWFCSKELDLIIWLDDSGSPASFQLCYDKGPAERALTWTPDLGFAHTAVDDGETDVGFRYKATPILVADGYFDAEQVLEMFLEASRDLPAELVDFVAGTLRQHPDYRLRA